MAAHIFPVSASGSQPVAQDPQKGSKDKSKKVNGIRKQKINISAPQKHVFLCVCVCVNYWIIIRCLRSYFWTQLFSFKGHKLNRLGITAVSVYT